MALLGYIKAFAVTHDGEHSEHVATVALGEVTVVVEHGPLSDLPTAGVVGASVHHKTFGNWEEVGNWFKRRFSHLKSPDEELVLRPWG